MKAKVRTGRRFPYEDCVRAVDGVLRTFSALRLAQPFGASRAYFKSHEPKSNRLTAVGVEFMADVENATNIALDGEPALKRCWARMMTGKLDIDQKLDIDRAESRDVIRLCGSAYLSRGIAPVPRYFKKIRHGRVEQRAAA